MSRQILARFDPDKKSAVLRQKIGLCAAALKVTQFTTAHVGEKWPFCQVCRLKFVLIFLGRYCSPLFLIYFGILGVFLDPKDIILRLAIIR